ncbi:PrgI family protein [Candidatus Roizmanbacteria bacterium]|nr:PrgI family protein [Candidatus Roizmanbacteria bacterium]
MDQHPIPRQITTFEFKLIGFLTIKQFIYLVIFVALGFAVYAITPIPILNIIMGVLTGAIGAAFAFIPINDRPMEVWIRNLLKRLTSPTQYSFHKQNKPISFLLDLSFSNNPHQITSHIDSQKKLNNYMSGKTTTTPTNNKKQSINDLLMNPLSFLSQKPKTSQPTKPTVSTQPQTPASKAPNTKHPFLTGMVKNHKLTPLGGILIYVKKETINEPIRILKSNIHGIFLSYNPLPPGEYVFESKDPKQSYFFDTMKVKVENENNQPIEIHSKELI